MSAYSASTRLLRALARAIPREEGEGVIELARYLFWRCSHADEDAASTVGEALRDVPVDKRKQTSADRRVKRWLQRGDPKGWKSTWRMLTAARKPSRRPRGAPKTHSAVWRTVWLLRAYFVRMTGEPQMALVAELLNVCDPRMHWTAARLQTGWKRRRRDFEPWDAERCLHAECCLAPDLWSGSQSFTFVISAALTRMGFLEPDVVARLKRMDMRRQELERARTAGPPRAADYPGVTLTKIVQHWAPSFRKRATYTSGVRIEIGRAGDVRRVVIERPSGNPSYDDSVRRAIREAAPFPPVPEDCPGESLTVRVSFWASTETLNGRLSTTIMTLNPD